jgi:hypothetical protein
VDRNSYSIFELAALLGVLRRIVDVSLAALEGR